MRREYGWPLAELGNIRLRRGDLAGAETAFLEAHQHAWSPQPGLALLRLAQGDITGATAMISDAIEHPFDMPSKERPPFGDLRLAPLFDAQAEIAFAAGDVATIRLAADRLARIAEQYPGPFLRSWTALATARAHLCEGDEQAAIDACRDAVAMWIEIGAPYEAAAARLVLGRAYDAAGRHDAARLEWNAAKAAFRDFGATARVAEADALIAGSSEPSADGTTRRSPTGPTVRFTTEGASRTIEFNDRTTTMRDLKGLRYVARLAAEPGREFHALDLVAVADGVLRADTAIDQNDDSSRRGGAAGLPMLDDTARDAYRRRLVDIDADIDDARRMNDIGRLELAERDREYLVAELTRAVGLGGRARTVGGTSERARTSVTRSIRYALDQLAAAQPELAARLRSCVHTGTYCSYEPDPVAPLVWTF
jgi:tetratricopeptide (TPR) repeat protein